MTVKVEDARGAPPNIRENIVAATPEAFTGVGGAGFVALLGAIGVTDGRPNAKIGSAPGEEEGGPL